MLKRINEILDKILDWVDNDRGDEKLAILLPIIISVVAAFWVFVLVILVSIISRQ